MVSIIIPIYNASQHLRQTIDAVLAQTFRDWSLLLIDDCSTDNSYELCKWYAAKDSRIVALQNATNSGPALTRNKGIEFAYQTGGGKYISFIDSDDTITEDYLEKLYKNAEQYHADIVWCNYWEYAEGDISSKKLQTHQLPTHEILKNDFLLSLFFASTSGLGSLCNKFYSIDFIKRTGVRLNPERVRAEDWEFNLMLFQQEPKVVAIEDALYNYIHYPRPSVMSTYRPKDYDMFWRSRTLLEDMAQKNHINYNQKKEDNTLIYHILNQLFLLSKATNNIDKRTEFSKIVTDNRLRILLRKGQWNVSLLPIRFRIPALLLWLDCLQFLRWYLKI